MSSASILSHSAQRRYQLSHHSARILNTTILGSHLGYFCIIVTSTVLKYCHGTASAKLNSNSSTSSTKSSDAFKDLAFPCGNSFQHTYRFSNVVSFNPVSNVNNKMKGRRAKEEMDAVVVFDENFDFFLYQFDFGSGLIERTSRRGSLVLRSMLIERYIIDILGCFTGRRTRVDINNALMGGNLDFRNLIFRARIVEYEA